jgi:DNA-binding CsgD family transcriptional regulator
LVGWYDRLVTATFVAVVGRDGELGLARRALEASGSAAIVVRGEPGIGKTTLWEAASAIAAATGRRLIVARPTEAERALALSVVSDLLQPVADEVLPALPAPQRRAVEEALLLSDAASGVDPRTLAAAFAASLRIVGGANGALLAIDDFQWADAASRTVVDFALRRLSSVGASAVIAVRVGNAAVPAFDPGSSLVVIDLGPLSLGALQRLLADRFNVELSRPLLRRVHAASGGNPFYALEIARALRDAGPMVADELPVPADLDGLLRARIDAMPTPTRGALAAAAALSEPRAELIEREGDLQSALDAGLVRVEGGVVRFTHPLLASAAYARLAPRRRRELHARLADVVDDVEQRARHLALAHPGPDESVAAVLEAAAESALERGAPAIAGELLELALQRTIDSERAVGRRLEAARAHARGGDVRSARRLAEEAVVELPPGSQRARALLVLCGARRDDFRVAAELAEQALQEAQGDRAVEALAASRLSLFRGYAGDMTGSLALAREALDRADALPAAAEVAIVAQAAFMQLHVTGCVDRRLIARGFAAEERSGGLSEGWEARYMRVFQSLFEERYEEARDEIEELIAHNEGLGYELRLEDLLQTLAVVETFAGRPGAGALAAARASEIRERSGMAPNATVLPGYFAALPAAYLGRVEEVRALTDAGIEASTAVGEIAFGSEHRAVRGFLELSLGDDRAAVEVLEPVAEKLAAVVPGMHPMHVPVLPNLIEALISLGRLDDARGYLEQLEERGRALDSAWALSQAARARGLLAAANSDTTGALAHFEAALLEHERSPGPFERARTLLARGTVQRRARKWRLARESLTAALAIFEEVETPLWADKARAELARIGGRRSAGGLTPTEARIAQLVAAGQSNKEIAAALVVTVRTVETHLTKVYAKLGVRSRTELASRLSR